MLPFCKLQLWLCKYIDVLLSKVPTFYTFTLVKSTVLLVSHASNVMFMDNIS